MHNKSLYFIISFILFILVSCNNEKKTNNDTDSLKDDTKVGAFILCGKDSILHKSVECYRTPRAVIPIGVNSDYLKNREQQRSIYFCNKCFSTNQVERLAYDSIRNQDREEAKIKFEIQDSIDRANLVSDRSRLWKWFNSLETPGIFLFFENGVLHKDVNCNGIKRGVCPVHTRSIFFNESLNNHTIYFCTRCFEETIMQKHPERDPGFGGLDDFISESE